jgi:hypothetical protein
LDAVSAAGESGQPLRYAAWQLATRRIVCVISRLWRRAFVAASAARHEHDTMPRDEATTTRQQQQQQQQYQHPRRTASSLKQSKSFTQRHRPRLTTYTYSADQPTLDRLPGPKIAPPAPPTKTKCRCPHLALSGSQTGYARRPNIHVEWIRKPPLAQMRAE